MKRILATVSSTILATGLVILPVASFAQDSSKATTPSAQSTAVQPSGTQTAAPAKTNVKPDAKTHVQVNKTETHGMNTGKSNDASTPKIPAAGGQSKG